jgi:hypothetical protein
MNHPSAAYGKALMKRDNKGGTLDPVEQIGTGTQGDKRGAS